MKGPSEFLMVLLLVAILFAGCTEKGEEDKEEETHLGEWTYDYLDASGSSEDGIDEIIGANNEFGLDIFRVLAEEDGNLFISPYSIFTALSMTYEGADGDTADEMKDVLHFPDDEDERRGSFASVQNGIRNESSDYDLSTANAIWPSKDHQFYDAFINMITRYYYGEVEELDYWNDPEGSRDTINDWADDETNGRIDELLPEGSIDPSVVMVLTNAIYFKGEWRYEFDEDDTYSGDFEVDDERTVTTDLMKMKTKLNYSEGDDVMMVELQYKGEELSMLLVLPKTGGLSDLIGELDWEMLQDLREGLSEEEVEVTLPKFKFENDLKLKDALKELGMTTAFTYSADFSRMTDEPIYIDQVYHDTFIEVNEQGTEAAAATAVVAKNWSASVTMEFKADRPFLFFIQQRDTGNILFMGRVSNPSV